MSEVLLQSIVEKLEAIEIGLLKGNTDKDPALQALLKEIKLLQAEMVKMPLLLTGNSEKVKELLTGIAALNFKLDSPKSECIKHSHYFHKGIWIAIGLFIISFLFLFAWINCMNSKKTFQANDIKYRFLRVSSNPSLLKLFYLTDSLYNLSNDSFVKLVTEKEQNFAQQEKQPRPASEKKRNARELLNKASKSFHKPNVIK